MIRPEEIDDIFEIGEINGNSVKAIKTIGGFYAATMKDHAGKDQVLAGGSHPALVKFSLKKKFGNNWHPILNKSEGAKEEQVVEKTHLLPKNLIDSGFNMNAVISDTEVSVVVDRFGVEVMTQTHLIKSDTLEVQMGGNIKDIQKASEAIDSGITKSLMLAAAETAKELDKETLSYTSSPQKVSVDKFITKLK